MVVGTYEIVKEIVSFLLPCHVGLVIVFGIDHMATGFDKIVKSIKLHFGSPELLPKWEMTPGQSQAWPGKK
jgi:hypothetical protein